MQCFYVSIDQLYMNFGKLTGSFKTLKVLSEDYNVHNIQSITLYDITNCQKGFRLLVYVFVVVIFVVVAAAVVAVVVDILIVVVVVVYH